jgi:hypothetical protein
MWKFVTGLKEPPAKKSKKDCQKEYEKYQQCQSSDDRLFEEFYIYSYFKG